MSIATKRIAYAGVLALGALAMSRAAQFRFQEKEDAIRQACREQLQKLGISRDAAKARYPTPEIHMVSSGCLTPGSTGEVVVKGKFVPDTRFVFANDNLEVVKDTLVGNEYRATVKVAADIAPQSADVIAITPVTGISVRQIQAVVVGGRYEWNMESANGWTIVARSPANKSCGGPAAEDVYAMEFFRKGESAAFEKREARLEFSLYEGLARFSVAASENSLGGAAEYQALMTKMTNPKLSSAEREAVMKELQKAQEQLQASMKKIADPAYAKSVEEQRKKFGCERMEVKVQAGRLTGQMRCAEAVGARVALTGALKFLGR
ncbi:MAG: hypothetical protein LAQ30_19460 [Acidobacteriia bacterium]|nr:hypothetical protein [Terriglobia bacterium]